MVHAIWQRLVRDICRLLLGRRGSYHHRLPVSRGSRVLPRHLADGESCRAHCRRCYQPWSECQQKDDGVSFILDIHCLHSHHVHRPSHRAVLVTPEYGMASGRDSDQHKCWLQLGFRVQGSWEVVRQPENLATSSGVLYQLFLQRLHEHLAGNVFYGSLPRILELLHKFCRNL